MTQDGAMTMATRPLGYVQSATGTRVQLTLAVSDYDHVRDLTSGEVRPEGIELTALKLAVEEIFFRFINDREWDVSEISMAKYAALRSQGDDSLVAIPVFPSRVFRHSSLYVRRGGPIKEPADLRGRRVGVPEWAQTAAVYSRGLIKHQYGIAYDQIDWVQAGVNTAGRSEKVALNLPSGVKLTPMPGRTLDDMLLDGTIDAIATAHPPESYERGDERVVRLFEDYRTVEEEYFRETGIYPIMHAIAIRRPVYDQAPWIAINLYKAFEEAKRRSLARARDMTAARFPIPWATDVARRAATLFGLDFCPYGIEPNRRTLDAFLGFAYEQGVCHRRLKVEELFPPQFRHGFKI